MPQKFSELCKDFLDWATSCRAKSTVYVYRHFLKKFEAFAGDIDATEITPAMVMAFAKSWHHVQALKRLYFWAVVEARVLKENPIAAVKHPPKGYRRRIMSPLERATIIRACKTDLRRLLIGYRETLARPHELRVAEWADIRPDDPAVSVADALVQGQASIILYEFKQKRVRNDSESPRVIILSPRMCRLLSRLWAESKKHAGPIFLTARGKAWTPNAVRCRFRRLRTRLKVKRDKRGESIVPYTFRHTGATLAAAGGVRDRLLADVLGHVETKTTARYCHLQVSHLRNAMKSVWGGVTIQATPRPIKTRELP